VVAAAAAAAQERCGTAKGDAAAWAGAQETHRWAWRLSLRGAPGRRDMKLYTISARYTEGIFLFLSPPIACPLAHAVIFRLQSRPVAGRGRWRWRCSAAVRINKKSSLPRARACSVTSCGRQDGRRRLISAAANQPRNH
jgi:hypothetical protein